MKTYVLIVAKTFQAKHNKAGHETYFRFAIQRALGIEPILPHLEIFRKKIHTIRQNYPLWEKRVKEVQEGKAVLSLREWSGRPYNSKQVEICKLEKIGVQKLEDPANFVFAPIDGKTINWDEVAKNDGLSFEDFCEWFKVRKNSPMAIIHFTDFRY